MLILKLSQRSPIMSRPKYCFSSVTRVVVLCPLVSKKHLLSESTGNTQEADPDMTRKLFTGALGTSSTFPTKSQSHMY